jgi:energy-converting hydrogenase Eha subunit B
MNTILSVFISIIFLGIGATLTFDLWGLFLQYAFKIKPAPICLVGRWIQYMSEGTFWHANIASAPQKSRECMVGWIVHYMIGVVFAIAFVAWTGNAWLQSPTFLPALIFGILMAAAPLFLMQPAMGLGIAGSKTANPAQTRLRTLMNHTAFGIGLYLFGLLASWLP